VNGLFLIIKQPHSMSNHTLPPAIFMGSMKKMEHLILAAGCSSSLSSALFRQQDSIIVDGYGPPLLLSLAPPYGLMQKDSDLCLLKGGSLFLWKLYCANMLLSCCMQPHENLPSPCMIMTTMFGAASSAAARRNTACHPISVTVVRSASVHDILLPHRCMPSSNTLLNALRKRLDLALLETCARTCFCHLA
jgi:hypothetical protein